MLPLDFFELLDLPELFFELEPPRDFALDPPLRDPPRFDDPLEPPLFLAVDLREPVDLRPDRELLLPPRDFAELLDFFEDPDFFDEPDFFELPDFLDEPDFFELLDLRDELPPREPPDFLLEVLEPLLRPDELPPPPRDDVDPPLFPPPELWLIRCAATAPITPPTTAPIGPATLPITAPVAAPAAGFGI